MAMLSEVGKKTFINQFIYIYSSFYLGRTVLIMRSVGELTEQHIQNFSLQFQYSHKYEIDIFDSDLVWRMQSILDTND